MGARSGGGARPRRPRALRADWREIESIDADDRRWLRGGRAPQGRFNAGQKVNTILTAAFALLFVVSGSMLWLGERDHRFILDGTGAVHELLTLGSVGLLVGHLYLAVIHPTTRHALRGMTTRRRARGLGARRITRSGSSRSEASATGYNGGVATAYRYVVADVFTDAR